MRVVHVARFFHPHIGGTENHIAELAHHVRELGVESVVIASARNSSGPGPEPSLHVVRVPVIGSNRLLLPTGGVAAVVDEIRRADVVHVHDLRFMFEFVTVTALRSDVPLVLGSHGLIFHTLVNRRIKEAIWRWYYPYLLRRYARVLCSSRVDLDHCRRIGLTNAQLVPDGVDTARFSSVEIGGERRGSLVYFGRIAPNKGIERLLQVLKHAPDKWTLTIIGTGEQSYVASLINTFKSVSERVRFVGALNPSELLRTLAEHDCIVLPSVYEGFGMTLVEAMATGVPVVASPIASYRHIAAGSPVRLVDFDDAGRTIETINEAIEHWDRNAARLRAEAFSWRHRAADFMAVYRNVRG